MLLSHCFCSGSSPQVRGTDPLPRQPVHRLAPRAVHPRRCGEQTPACTPPCTAGGSSPQVRGTGLVKNRNKARIRFIPAGAGNSHRLQIHQQGATVHPRRCGEQANRNATAISWRGSSPQVRGTAPHRPPRFPPARFIPAGAGNSFSVSVPAEGESVHPRRCGEQHFRLCDARQFRGSSPQVRGTVIAAGGSHESNPVHPRRCGEQGGPMSELTLTRGSSPQVRGTAPHQRQALRALRFIPAGAGNRFRPSPFSSCHAGSSPQVRGTDHGENDGVWPARFIPAGAGNSTAG